MTMCNVKVVTTCEEPTENYHLTLQFPSTLKSIFASFLLIILVVDLFCFSPCSLLSSTSFQSHQAAVFSNKKQ